MSDFFLFILILFAIAALLRIDFFFSVLYLFFGLYVLARAWTGRALQAIGHRRRFEDRAFLGERVTVELEITNQGLLPLPWLRIHECLPIELTTPNFFRRVLTLLPRERTSFSYQLHCRRRGYYPLGPLFLNTGDLFGLEERGAKGAKVDHLIVYPKIVPLERLGLPSRSPFVSLPSGPRLFEDPARVRGVRDYHAGDSPRHINWKTSASQGQLLVKQYEPAIAQEVAIFLNLNAAEYGRRRREAATELAIVVAASLANHLIGQCQAVGLCTNGRDPLSREGQPVTLPPRKERAHLMGMLDILARIEAAETTPFVELLRREGRRLPWATTLVVITGREDETLFDALFQLRRAGFSAALILVDVRGRPSLTQRRVEELGIPVHRVRSEEDMDLWR